ncbi:hypothetical protein [Thioalkalivibrio sp. HK1]|uniref:hypothetical protein n=1 Tax=Thioalkalivibrio sp. HK1 TaxID=1469245 RepID=UPI0012DE9193|nr:hypothetical protein [Thioalkalivibrio sp. HK1]
MKDSQNIDPAEPRSDYGRYLVRRSGRRLSILETTLLIALLGLALTLGSSAFSDWRIKARVIDATRLIADARKELEDSCNEGQEVLESASPPTDSDPPEPDIAIPLPGHIRDIIVEPIGAIEDRARAGRISIVFAAIDDSIEEGDRLVFTADCRKGATDWSIGGDLPLKYRPNP